MSFVLRSIIILTLSVSFVFAQKIENSQIKLTRNLLSPTNQDIALAESEGLNAFKILPRGMFDVEKNSLLLRGGGAYYSFTKKSHSYNDTPQISLEKGNLKVGFYGASYGLLTDLGQSSFEIAKLTAEADFLLKYAPPKFEPEIRAEKKKSRNYEINGIILREKVPVIIGNSYLLRAISFRESDTLVYLKIYRQTVDGSSIIFWKTIRVFKTPVILHLTDEEFKAKVESALFNKGFRNVIVEVKNNEVTLKGSVPSERFAEALVTVNELSPRMVINYLQGNKQ